MKRAARWRGPQGALLAQLINLLALASCTRQGDSAGPGESAQFGLFFGGQIQERERIPFELDASKPAYGFRVRFSEPLQEPRTVSWELDMPAHPRAGEMKGMLPKRAVVTGTVTLKASEQYFEKTFHFAPGDPLGLWNFRLTSGEHVLIDRPFVVEAPSTVQHPGAP